MPTGGGKSLCYQLPSLVMNGITIVVSPLIALMQNQVNDLKAKGINASVLNSTVRKKEKESILKELKLKKPSLKLLYVTPELISKSNFLEHVTPLYNRNLLNGFIIDESHCISIWGHDWRPSYGRLSILKEKFPNVPVLACTATATYEAQNDIITSLKMKNPVRFTTSFNRENIYYEVRYKSCIDNVIHDITDFILSYEDGQRCGIIYCHKRNDCEEVSSSLVSHNIKSAPYHAGLNEKDRKLILEKWISGEFEVVVATIAFGMGIDNPNVRFVIHHTLSQSLEDYYQESGRGGRDGNKAKSILYYSDKDKQERLFLLNKSKEKEKKGSVDRSVVQMRGFSSLVQYCEGMRCRRQSLLSYFGENIDPKVVCKGNCDFCENPEKVKEAYEYTKSTRSSMTMFDMINVDGNEEKEYWANKNNYTSLNPFKCVQSDDIKLQLTESEEKEYIKKLEMKERNEEKYKVQKKGLMSELKSKRKSRVVDYGKKRIHNEGSSSGFQTASSIMKNEINKNVKKQKLEEKSFF